MKRARAHVQYKVDGKRVPGVTTITGLLAKPALVPWANRMGLMGIDTNKYVDALAGVGTLTHKRIEYDLLGKDVDFFDEYSKVDTDLSDNAMVKYYDWKKHHKIESVKTELQLTSKEYGYGGTCDIYCLLDGVPTLIDIKTGKAIYSDMFVQVAGYKILLEENIDKVDQCFILNVGRDETENFEFRKIHNMSEAVETFLLLRKLYDLKKALK